MVNFQVRNGNVESSFALSLPKYQCKLERYRAISSILCDLKRKISETFNIDPINQSISNLNESFIKPNQTIKCNVSDNQQHSSTITVNSWDDDEYNLRVNFNKDSVLNLKFALSEKLKTKPEYINFVMNFTERILSNMDTLSKCNITSTSKLHYWIEIPINNNSNFVIRGAPELAKLPQISHCTNVGRMIRYSLQKYGNLPYLGRRAFNSDGSRGAYEWTSYNDVNRMITCLGNAYIKLLGLQAGKSIVGICAGTRLEWSLCEYAFQCKGFVSVPMYSTLARNAIHYIADHASVEVVVCDKSTLESVSKMRDKCPSLKHVILMDMEPMDAVFVKENPKNANGSGTGYDYTVSELIEFGKTCEIQKDCYTNADELSCIMYTSGTTGDPKGVMWSHRSYLTSVYQCGRGNFSQFYQPGESTLFYLPQAHAYGKVMEIAFLYYGVKLGYFQGDLLKIVDDLQALKPTLFMGVPRVLQKFQDKVLSQKVLLDGYKQGNAAIINKIKQIFGGKLKCTLCGSAPISAETMKFAKTCISPYVIDGYGMTEIGIACCANSNDECIGQVGCPSPIIEMKLMDVSDMNYTVRDEPEPRGEIWIRGDGLFEGYYKNPGKTAEDMKGDGWFATGDIGKWRIDGKLSIIDRKKNIFKLAQGEYIRPEYIENIYKMSTFIGNIFIDGHSTETYLVAIVYPDMDVVRGYCGNEESLKYLCSKSNEEIIKNGEIRRKIEEEMNKIEMREKLIGFEKVKKFEMISEDFTIENGILTSTMKLKRNVARKAFEDVIDRMYNENKRAKL